MFAFPSPARGRSVSPGNPELCPSLQGVLSVPCSREGGTGGPAAAPGPGGEPEGALPRVAMHFVEAVLLCCICVSGFHLMLQ